MRMCHICVYKYMCVYVKGPLIILARYFLKYVQRRTEESGSTVWQIKGMSNLLSIPGIIKSNLDS